MPKPRPLYVLQANCTSGADLLQSVRYWQARADEWRQHVAAWQSVNNREEAARCRASVLRCIRNMVHYRRALALQIQR